ncbi:MAG: ABC transporter permease, partial [Ignavibacteriales bacterium]|nr:ABC transporter permease [Ignavibacteriales bacterium]
MSNKKYRGELTQFEKNIVEFFRNLGNLNSFAFSFFKALWFPPYDF